MVTGTEEKDRVAVSAQLEVEEQENFQELRRCVMMTVREEFVLQKP